MKLSKQNAAVVDNICLSCQIKIMSANEDVVGNINKKKQIKTKQRFLKYYC